METAGFASLGRLGRGALGTAAALAMVAGGVPVAASPGSGAARRVPPPGVISTVAGGVGGPAKATEVALGSPVSERPLCGVSFGAGRLYLGDGVAVRAVDPSTGRLTTPAGTGVTGPLGDGGPAARARLAEACGVVVDHAGNLLISDTFKQRVRVVAAHQGTFYGRAMKSGHIYTVAGDGHRGFSGDGGPATGAEVSAPDGIAVDAAGNLVLADAGNQRARVVAESSGSFYGRPMTAGDIYTVAGDGIAGFSGDGGPATSAELSGPLGVAVDGAGNLLIADSGNHRARVVAASSGTFYGQAMKSGHIYAVAGNGTAGFSGDGGPATSAELSGPQALAVDGAGNLVIADTFNHRVRAVAASGGSFYGQAMKAGNIYTVAGNGRDHFSGDGGPATRAELFEVDGVATDGAGNLLIADAGNTRVRVAAHRTGTFYGRAMTAGDIYTVAGSGGRGFSGDRGPATKAKLFAPTGMAADAAGNLLIADSQNNRIRVVAARTGTFYGQPMTARDIYTVAGGGAGGDGGPATSAGLSHPGGVAVDAAGNLVITDSADNRVRVVAARTGTFYGQPMSAGDIYTVAGNGYSGFSGDGGPATSAELSPGGVAVDAAGNLVITDALNNRVRVVAESTARFYGQPMTAGDIYTVAGNGHSGFSGDGDPATSAELSNPNGVAVNTAGNLVIAALFNNRIRMVTG